MDAAKDTNVLELIKRINLPDKIGNLATALDCTKWTFLLKWFSPDNSNSDVQHIDFQLYSLDEGLSTGQMISQYISKGNEEEFLSKLFLLEEYSSKTRDLYLSVAAEFPLLEKEMRSIAYNLPKGGRRSAYAFDLYEYMKDLKYSINDLEHFHSRFEESIKPVSVNKEHIKNTTRIISSNLFTIILGKEVNGLWRLFESYFSDDLAHIVNEYEKPDFIIESNPDTKEETFNDEGLTAVQSLLLIRILQEVGHFPNKAHNTDSANELKAIALITGLSYQNDLKGGRGAIVKVNELLDERSRNSLSEVQVKHKLKDLDAVEEIAQLLNAERVIDRINYYRKELKKILP